MSAKARFIKMLIAAKAVKSEKGKLVTINQAKADAVKAEFERIISTGKKTGNWPKGWAKNKTAKKSGVMPKGWATAKGEKTPQTTPFEKATPKPKATPKAKPREAEKNINTYSQRIELYKKTAKSSDNSDTFVTFANTKGGRKLKADLLKYYNTSNSYALGVRFFNEINGKPAAKKPTQTVKKKAVVKIASVNKTPYKRKIVEVNATQKQALEDVLNLKKYEKVGAMFGGMVYSKWKNDPNLKIEKDSLGNMQSTVFEKNNFTLVENNGRYDDYYTLTPFGKDFINSVNGRLASLKNISTGSDLFERTAKLAKPKGLKKTKFSSNAFVKKYATVNKQGEYVANAKLIAENAKLTQSQQKQVLNELRKINAIIQNRNYREKIKEKESLLNEEKRVLRNEENYEFVWREKQRKNKTGKDFSSDVSRAAQAVKFRKSEINSLQQDIQRLKYDISENNKIIKIK
jgi:hypothetical protein